MQRLYTIGMRSKYLRGNTVEIGINPLRLNVLCDQERSHTPQKSIALLDKIQNLCMTNTTGQAQRL